MGIKNLWQLLSPVGRSVSIETLAGKTLAVDASIWLTQFIKAMRDDDGKVVKNAHIVGTLRRVVKLLFHRIRPVFVFDGGAPALKNRTLAARRKIRAEGTEASVRKTAQRILASQLKKHKAALRHKSKSSAVDGTAQTAPLFNPVYQSTDGNNGQAASSATVADRGSLAGAAADEPETPRNSRGMETLPGHYGAVAAGGSEQFAEAAMAAAAASGEDGGGDHDEDDDANVDWEEGGDEGNDGGGALGAGRRAVVDSDGDEVWEPAADSRTAWSGGKLGVAEHEIGGATLRDGGEASGSEEDREGDWEEVDLPDRDEDIDPEVIASLPDHVKKQVIEAAKRRHRLRSRAQYMPVASDPAMYSQTQLSNFLRSQKLNAQIMRVHKNDDGDQVGKKIASEAGRRYIMIPAGENKDSHDRYADPSGSRATGRPIGSTSAAGAGAAASRRRRRIADEGEDFHEWSYERQASPSDPDVSSLPSTGASSSAVREAATGDVASRKECSRVVEEIEEEEEEAGGFLPESDDEKPSVTDEAEMKGEEKGPVISRGGDVDSSDNDVDWVEMSKEEPSTHKSPSEATKKGEGTGKGKAKVDSVLHQHVDLLNMDSSGSDDEQRHGNGSNRNSDTKHQRFRRLAQLTGDSKGHDRKDEIDLRSEVASERIARHLQEEEDRRTAVALQNGQVLQSPSKGGSSLDRGRQARPRESERAGAVDAGAKLESKSECINLGIAGSGAPDASEPTASSSMPKRHGGDDDVGIELEIDPSDLQREGAGGGGAGRSDLVALFSSVTQGKGVNGGEGPKAEEMRGDQRRHPDYDSDEDYDGFEDVDFGGNGKNEELEQEQVINATNEAALQRSVDMASRMAGWAGRVVARVLKEHKRAGVPSSTSAPSASQRTRTDFPAFALAGAKFAAMELGSPGSAAEPNFEDEADTNRRRSGPGASFNASFGGLSPEEDRRRLGSGTSQRSMSHGTEEPQWKDSDCHRVVEDAISVGGGSNDACETPDGMSRVERPVLLTAVSSASKSPREDLGSDGNGGSDDGIPDLDGGQNPTRGDGKVASSVEVTSVEPVASSCFIEADQKSLSGEHLLNAKTSKTRDHVKDVSSYAHDTGHEKCESEAMQCESRVEKETEDAQVDGRSASSLKDSQGTEGTMVTGKMVDVDSSSSLSSLKVRQDSCNSQGDASVQMAISKALAQGPVDASGNGKVDSTRAGDVKEAGAASARLETGTPTVLSKEEEELVSSWDGATPRKYSNAPIVRQAGGSDPMFQPFEHSEVPDDSLDFTITVGSGSRTRGGAAALGYTSGIGGDGREGGGVDDRIGGLSYLGEMDEDELALESDKLQRESHRAKRDAETVTDEMKEEVMDLLQLFGVPYVIAPMEAEAQCCELERLRLVDGTVTDDSDAFAFGGRAVYKNIFNERKYVEAYLLPDAEKDLGVGTDEVIALALLLGSDYTEGVKGVGIVNAMEIIHAFPLEGKGPHFGLNKFKKWIDEFNPMLDQELDDLVKNGSKADIEGLSLARRFHLKHRSARNRWAISEGFPSEEVINAYKNPQVDKSDETFSWAMPDVDGLRALCQRVLGWDRKQSDDLIMPMVKVLQEGSFSQKRIDSYFMTYHDNRRVAAIKSKRLRTAVEDLAGAPSEVLMVGNYGEVGISTRKRKKPSKKANREGTEASGALPRKDGEDGVPELSASSVSPPNRRAHPGITHQDVPEGNEVTMETSDHHFDTEPFVGSTAAAETGRIQDSQVDRDSSISLMGRITGSKKRGRSTAKGDAGAGGDGARHRRGRIKRAGGSEGDRPEGLAPADAGTSADNVMAATLGNVGKCKPPKTRRSARRQATTAVAIAVTGADELSRVAKDQSDDSGGRESEHGGDEDDDSDFAGTSSGDDDDTLDAKRSPGRRQKGGAGGSRGSRRGKRKGKRSLVRRR